jgi:hypothetical protein
MGESPMGGSLCRLCSLSLPMGGSPMGGSLVPSLSPPMGGWVGHLWVGHQWVGCLCPV